MPICDMKSLLSDAAKKNRAVGSFSVGNMEMIMGVIKGAEIMQTPIIMQIAEVRLSHAQIELIGSMMVWAAKKASVDVAVHFDHGRTFENIKKTLDLGFTSVMYDGSLLPLEKNIEDTIKVASMAREFGATVEAELGQVGGSEDGSEDHKMICTDPDQAEYFCKKTGVDALAVAIGNAHGNYIKKPNLQLGVLEEIRKKVDAPLVLHGGTGISNEDFRKCIDLGIRKINIATGTFDKTVESAKQYIESSDSLNYFSMNEAMVEAISQSTQEYIKVFNNKD